MTRQTATLAAPSVLELAMGGVPFPHGGPDGAWRYRHAVRPEGPTALDHQVVADFFAYERAHRRNVIVVADPARFDGVHPVKIAGEVPLDDLLVAVVVPARQRATVADRARARLRDRVVVLDIDAPRPETWATAALTAAQERAR